MFLINFYNIYLFFKMREEINFLISLPIHGINQKYLQAGGTLLRYPKYSIFEDILLFFFLNLYMEIHEMLALSS